MLQPSHHPLEAILPNTRYFEIVSDLATARYGIWVTTPPGYDADPERVYAGVYMTDGNLAAPRFVPSSPILPADPIAPIEPIVQIAIGYCGAEAHDSLRVRNRDLIPPGEPVNPQFDAAIDGFVVQGVMTTDEAVAYKASLRQTRADRFLAFLTDELHPAICQAYRIDPDTAGLFGASYGGLFALWAAFKRAPLFKKVGAHSPGIISAESQVFRLLDNAQAADTDFAGRQLHVTICEREITFPSFYQMLGQNFALLLARLGTCPLSGLALSARIIPDESHATGTPAGWSSFLRTCYPGDGPA